MDSEYVDYRTALWKKKYGDASLSRPDFLTDDEKRRIKHGEYYGGCVNCRRMH